MIERERRKKLPERMEKRKGEGHESEMEERS